VEVRLLESIQEAVFVGEVHESETNWGKESDDGLQSHEEGSDKGSFNDVGILIAKLELIKSKYSVQLILSFEIKQSLL
jgi:hypothetical protein